MALFVRNSFLPELLNDFITSSDIDDRTWISEPSVNVKEDNDFFALELAVPGMVKEDIKIDIDHKELKISANKEINNEKNGYLRREFQYGNFEKTFELPESVNSDNITAHMDNGILIVNLPKKEEAKVKPAREIKIA
jgi:HSP20 family protein